MASVLASSTTRMILGLGETGTSVARWFVSQGIEFLATDTRPEVLTSVPVREAVGSDRRLVAAEDPEQRGLATAALAQHREDLSVLDLEGRVIQQQGVLVAHRQAPLADQRLRGRRHGIRP